MSNSQIDAFIKKMKTPLYEKTPPKFKYGRLLGRALRIESGLTELKARNTDLEDALKMLMEWQVKNIDKWHNAAYDNACAILKKAGVLNDEPHH